MPREADAAAVRELAILEQHPARSTPPPAPRCEPLQDRSTTDYVTAAGAQVLVRYRGDLRGARIPTVVVPAAPGASALYESLIATLSVDQPVIAFDLPGHGESDPLPGNEQSVEAWTRVALGVLDALGIARANLYGHNGGAAVALEVARVAPTRVVSLTLDAPIALDAVERASLAPRYAVSIEPSWEGAHLLRAWHHLRDQELWWPWFDRAHTSIKKTVPRIDPEQLTLRVREMLKQPSSYVAAWQATLGYPLLERLAEHDAAAIPTRLTAAPDDVFAHLIERARRVSARDGALASGT
ncbi:MAG: alpha/beta fold hydrolase, partial [Burkholderiales bacterium]